MTENKAFEGDGHKRDKEPDKLSHHEKKSSEITDEISDPQFSCISKSFIGELKMNITIAFPVMISNIFQYSLTIETMSFCGRLSSVELEGVGLALSLMSAVGWCVCYGMVSACDTMFSQSFGSKNKKRIGLFLQRGILLMNLVPVFLWALHVNFEPLMILLRQDKEISRIAGEFMITFTPGLTFMLNYLLLARYMQNQGCLWPPVLAAVCGNIFNICSNLLFVFYLGYGFRAASLCHALSYFVMVVIEVIYIYKSKFYVATWPGLQLEALYDWSGMFRLGLAGVGNVAFEVFVWEASVFMGGIIGNVQLATQSILLQLLSMMFMIYYGSGIASNIRVGQCLGANRPNQAKMAYRAGVAIIGLGTILIASFIIGLRYQIPHVFTDKQEVIDMIIDTLPYLYLLMWSDPFNGVCSATIRGSGRQLAGCLIIFISFYVLSLPTTIVLAFVFKFGIKGIWIGNSVGSVVSVSSFILLLECQDWNHQAYLAQKRILFTSVQPEEKDDDDDEDSSEKEFLFPLQMNEESEIKLPSHIRTPSHPIMCSTGIVKLPRPRVILQRSMIIKRMIIAGCVFIFFLCGLSIHLFLPTSIYRSATNSSISQP